MDQKVNLGLVNLGLGTKVDRGGPFTTTLKTHFYASHAHNSGLCKVGGSGPERTCTLKLQAIVHHQGSVRERKQGSLTLISRSGESCFHTTDKGNTHGTEVIHFSAPGTPLPHNNEWARVATPA